MPIIHVNVWEGWGPQKAKAAIEGITQVFVDLGVPAHAVEVVVHEIPKSHWGIGGQPASERFGSAPPEGERARVLEAAVNEPSGGPGQA
jgi:4-oxalocrotonate tautomerase